MFSVSNFCPCLGQADPKSTLAEVRLHLSLSGPRTQTLTLNTQGVSDFRSQANLSRLVGWDEQVNVSDLGSVHTGGSGWDFLKQGWDPAQRDSVALTQTRDFPFPLITSCVALFSLLQMARTTPPFPRQTPITHQGQTSASPAKRPLTRLHTILGLSMGSPSHPHKSSLSPTSL